MGRDCERHGEDGLVTAPNPSRRAFLRAAGGMAGAAAIAGSGIGALLPEVAYAHAGRNQLAIANFSPSVVKDLKKKVPPGILYVRDGAIIDAYLDWKHPYRLEQYNDINSQDIARTILRLNDWSWNEYIKKDTPYHEPAFWFMVNLVQGNNSAHYPKLKAMFQLTVETPEFAPI